MAAGFTGMPCSIPWPILILIAFRMYSNNSTRGASPPCSSCLDSLLRLIGHLQNTCLQLAARVIFLTENALGEGKVMVVSVKWKVRSFLAAFNAFGQTFTGQILPWCCVEYLQIAASLWDCTARVCYLAPLPNDTSWNSRIKVTKVCQNRAKRQSSKSALIWIGCTTTAALSSFLQGGKSTGNH